MALTEKYRLRLLSAAGSRQQDFGQSGDLLRGGVPEEQTGFKHFQLDHTPAVVGVSKEVDPSVGPPSRRDRNGPLGDVQDFWGRRPGFVLGAKIILNPVIARHRNFLYAMGRLSAPIEHGVFAFDHHAGTKRLQQHFIKGLEQGFGVLAGSVPFARHGKGEGSAGGRTNGWLEKSSVPSKALGIFDPVEILGCQPDGGHGGHSGLSQIPQVALVHVPAQGGGGIAEVAFMFAGIDPLGEGFRVLLIVPSQPGDHEIVGVPISVLFPVGGLKVCPKLAQGRVQWLVVHFPFGEILAASKGQPGRHAFEGILCGLPRRSIPWSTCV